MKSWHIIAWAQAQAPTDAQMGHGVDHTGGTVAPTQAVTGCLLCVQAVGSGGGKCRVVRSGREPPVFMAGRRTGTVAGLSGDQKMLIPGTSQDRGREEDQDSFLVSHGFSKCLPSSKFSSIEGALESISPSRKPPRWIGRTLAGTRPG